MRRVLGLGLAALLVVAVVVGLGQAGGPSEREAKAAPFDLQTSLQRLKGAPAPLAALHAQSADVLEGGRTAFRRRLAELRGHPVVVNVWASWCGPCRHEYPMFQRAGTAHGREVAFLGVDTQDARGPATRFLRETPVPYPSYLDPKGAPIARSLGLGQSVPATVFLDRRGRTAFARQGGYASTAELDADIDRYLG